MNKTLALILSAALLSLSLCSCKLQNIINQNVSEDSNAITQTESSEIVSNETISDIETSSEKDETSSKTSSKPSSSDKADKSSKITNTSSEKKLATSSQAAHPSYSVTIPVVDDLKGINPIEQEDYYGWKELEKNGTEAERKAYKIFFEAFSQYQKKVTFDFKITSEELIRVYDIYIDDHPQHFWLGRASYNTVFNNIVTSFIVASDMMGLGEEKIEKMDNEARKAATRIIKELFPNGVPEKEIEIVRAVHDYLVNNVKYDTTHDADNSHNMYGALISGVAVCEGYAEAFQYIMRLCGVQSIVVKGSMNGINHEWNMVKVEDQWYHIDVTSDDPVVNGGSEQVLRFDYFNLTEAEIKKTHTIYGNVNSIPKATETEYNFFKYYGLEFTELDTAAFVNSISFSLKNSYDTAYFKLNGITVSDAVDFYLDNISEIAEVVNNNKLGKKIKLDGSAGYSQNKQKNILSLKLNYQ